jgi:GNAT superfamily N-acetyltransferase
MELMRIERHDQALNPELRKRAEHVRSSKITKVFVAREGGQEVAFVALDCHPPGELWLYDLLVPKDMRRNHVGTRVLQAVERLAKQFGYTAVYLHPKSLDEDFPDEELVKWYAKSGYVKVGERHDLSLSKSLSETE